jgi:hypothetical protein
MDAVLPRGAATLLVAGAVIFWIGAVTPPYRQWMGVGEDEYLQIVGANRTTWLFMHACFAAGAVTTAAGLGALASRAWQAGAASTLFTIATILWLVNIGFRVTAAPRAAAELTRTGAVPTGYTAGAEWVGVLFGAQMIASYLAILALGLGLRETGFAPRWIANAAIGFGAIAVPGLLTPVFQPPLMVYVVPFTIGVATLFRGEP